MALRGGLLFRLEKQTIKSESGCWLMVPGSRGYSKIKFLGRTEAAHRVSYELYNGSVPVGMMVCHRCDVRNCVNPDHLFLGTALENMQDKVQKGRHKGAKSGENHHKAKLTEWQVEEIRKRLGHGETQSAIAKDYGTTQSTISHIKRRRNWS